MENKNENIRALELDEMETVSGGWHIANGTLIPSCGCRCGSAPEDMTLTSVSIHENGQSTLCRFICSKCGRPLNGIYDLYRYEEFKSLLGN